MGNVKPGFPREQNFHVYCTCIVLGMTEVMPKGSLRSSLMVESDVWFQAISFSYSSS